jgi:Helix-turn-helix domain
MMPDDRERLGLSVARASWLLGVSVRRYRDLEDGEAYQSYGEWTRMVDVFGWPRSFASARASLDPGLFAHRHRPSFEAGCAGSRRRVWDSS